VDSVWHYSSHRIGSQHSEPHHFEAKVARLSEPLEGPDHPYKYSLALVVAGECILRYDNECGKGDHKHEGDVESTYAFTTLSRLLSDFKADVARVLING